MELQAPFLRTSPSKKTYHSCLTDTLELDSVECLAGHKYECCLCLERCGCFPEGSRNNPSTSTGFMTSIPGGVKDTAVQALTHGYRFCFPVVPVEVGLHVGTAGAFSRFKLLHFQLHFLLFM